MAKETEIIFYAKIGNPDGLSQASVTELHAQSEYRIPTSDGSKRKIRVRKTTIENQTSWSESIKFGDTAEEFETKPISEDYFNAWLRAFGQPICNKIRYIYPAMKTRAEIPGGEVVELPDLRFEVDVLIHKDGRRSAFCKVEVEIDPILEFLKDKYPNLKIGDAKVLASSLPLGLSDVFSPATEEGKTAEKIFYEEFCEPAKSSPALSASMLEKSKKESLSNAAPPADAPQGDKDNKEE